MLSGKDNKNYTVTVDGENSGNRIDIFLSKKIPVKSRTSFQKIIIDGRIRINEIPVKNKKTVVYEGDIIKIEKYYENEKDLQNEAVPFSMELDIKYEDKYFMVLSKPPGITVHPASGNYENTLAGAVLYHLKKTGDSYSDKLRAGIVHRLDKDTSGLIIVAKSEDMLHLLSGLFKNRQVKKTYMLLAAGIFAEKEGAIKLPLGRSRTDRKKISVSSDRGKYAETGFKVIEKYSDCTLLYAFPLTGRTHQIRVHFSFIGHPVIGDSKYGNKSSEEIAARTGLKRHFLHAVRLEFLHPVSQEKMDIKDNISRDLERTVKILNSEKKII